MEATAYHQIAVLPPNPTTKRGFRLSWSSNPSETHIAYPCMNNVVLRDLKNPHKSVIYTDYLNKVTSVKYSPNGNYVASGDEKGKIKVFSYNEASNDFIVKKEYSLLTGAVQQITWTDDSQRLAGVGEGKDIFAKAVIADSGSKLGDLFGPTKNILTVDIRKKPYRLAMAGETQELFIFDGVPFKPVKTLFPHSNFVNQVSFNGDGTLLVSVSSDKSIVVHDAQTLEQIQKIEKAHTKGVMDISWVDQDTIITCSTDGTVKAWNAREGTQLNTLTLREDTEENVEDQQLALLANKDCFLTTSLNSNINVWTKNEGHETQKKTPSSIIQGHSTYITQLQWVQDCLLSADQDGKVFQWSKDYTPTLVKGEGHTCTINALTSSKTHLFSSSVDGTIMKSAKTDGEAFQYQVSNKLDGMPIALAAGKEGHLFALLHTKVIAVIETEKLTVSRTFEVKEFEPTALSYSTATNELWVGDKTGSLYILNAEDFSQKQVVEKKHNHQITYITASGDGKLVASGDNYRYIYVFNSETKEEVGCYPYHTSKIMHLDFSSDAKFLLTTSTDLNAGVIDIAAKTKKVIQSKHGFCQPGPFIGPNEKILTCAVFGADNQVCTAGYDCAVRVWSL